MYKAHTRTHTPADITDIHKCTLFLYRVVHHTLIHSLFAELLALSTRVTHDAAHWH